MATYPGKLSNRLLSLDFMRGLIMVLLAFEAAGIYRALSADKIAPALMVQFTHHVWHGLHLWDLVQPGFMFIAGTSMAFSLTKQKREGIPWKKTFLKVLKRSGWLLFFGILIAAVRPKGLSFELWNVLAQLAFTTLVAFLIFQWKITTQLLFCLGLLLLTEVLYRFTNIPGFDQPFTDQHNFGNFVDLILMNKINPKGWAAINCIPTSVHTILGAVAGKVLLDESKSENAKVRTLLIGSVICLILGYALDFANITPIIKRIATTSFTLASGGWCLLGLMLCYWWIDVLNHKKHLTFFTIVGANSLFIYLFFEIAGKQGFNKYINSLFSPLMSMASIPAYVQIVVVAIIIFLLEWRLCYFLYKRNIFFKI